MADENDVLESWEELDDKEVLDKRLQDIKITQVEKNGTDVMSQMKEEGSRTQYTPQVRILKRSTDNAESAKNNKSKVQVQPQKTLEQREAEYKEARLRILGEGYSGAGAENCNNSATVTETRPVKLIKQAEEMKLQPNKVQLLREPRGPDGTPGFDQNR